MIKKIDICYETAITISNFAAYVGVTPSAVTRWRDAGYLEGAWVESPTCKGARRLAGYEEAAAALKKNNPSLYQRHKATFNKQKKQPKKSGALSELDSFIDGDHRLKLEKAKADKAHYDALNAQAAYEKTMGTLVEREIVRKEARSEAARVSANLLNIPARLAAQLAWIDDESEIREVLDREIRQVLNDLADGKD